jgi:pimeloyl-ACP methyl ester carboxylesterase
MGTQVCLEHWHRHRENVKAMVLLCGSYGKVTSTFRGTPILDWLLPKMLPFVEQHSAMVRALWSRLPADLALKAGLKAGEIDPARMNPEDLRPYLEHMVHVDLPMFLRMLRGAGEHSAETWLSEIDVPVLVVAGEKDTFTPASLSTFMAETIPKAELLVVEGGTHAAPIEAHERINARIAEFLTRALRKTS